MSLGFTCWAGLRAEDSEMKSYCNSEPVLFPPSHLSLCSIFVDSRSFCAFLLLSFGFPGEPVHSFEKDYHRIKVLRTAVSPEYNDLLLVVSPDTTFTTRPTHPPRAFAVLQASERCQRRILPPSGDGEEVETQLYQKRVHRPVIIPYIKRLPEWSLSTHRLGDSFQKDLAPREVLFRSKGISR